MHPIYMTVAARSDVGRVRNTNEDTFALVDLATGSMIPSASSPIVDIADRRILLALSDGMGGHEAGEIASALVVQAVASRLQNANMVPIEQAIDVAARHANQVVATAARERGKHGMGATLTAVVLSGPVAWIAVVGDSRVYLMRGGRLRQLTRDQSFVQMLVDQGVLTPEAARTSPQKNVILQAIGVARDVRVAIGRLALRRDDRLLLCCDGISNAMTDAEIATIVGGLGPTLACDHLINLANERGGEDNLTAIVAALEGDGLDTQSTSETITSTFRTVQAP
jgi:serine/threonine protein phosphatase PrpC